MSAAFRGAGLDEPEAAARALICGLLKISKAQLISGPERLLGRHALLMDDAMRRHLDHEPVSRILGTKEFYGRPFSISQAVLDPRPDTETVVDLVLDIVDREGWRDRPLSIADIGTGSGCILLTLLAELPGAMGVGTDISAAALEQARKNATALGLGVRARFLHTRGLAGTNARYDIIVSNPPYIATGEIERLDRAVRCFDPAGALDGGADGFAIYREIASEIMAIRQPIWVVLELGAGQLSSVAGIFTEAAGDCGKVQVLTRNDLGGHTRAVALKIHW